jgi:antigen flippase
LILFTDKFVPMRDLFSWQLIGDFFKILSYVGGYVFVAKGSTKLYISAEILQAGLFIGGAYLFVPDNGALGAVRAYALTYTIYFLAAMTVLFFYFRDLATPKPAEPS